MAEPALTIIRALIVDDHRLFNDGLKSMLANEPSIDVVGQVYQSKDTPNAVARLTPDILLMDFNMPGINGLDLTRQLLRDWPRLNVLILSMYAEQRHIDEFKKAGVKGYVLKTADVDEVVKAIRVTADGGMYFGLLNTRTADPHADDGFMRKFRLTPREVEVIGLIRQGLTNPQIADRMNVSFYTIETHRRNVYLKLDVNSTADLIRFMEENGG
ncbi:response regulator [Spirosoma montaniterrae]|uniref:LuxR family transcriptional regulator n=1 Tax=Spirosoma montaniterrae TaxID=1178516 RepID=A0A1P9WT24_9BACT|nr:response regulator transcription factor [Spirosoma montaniterrae]AQG78483.1 hypothetical protein AWR27_03485 [Spirosoma montaniterrae]